MAWIKTFAFVPLIVSISCNAIAQTPDIAKLTQQAESGDAKAQLGLGIAYFTGQGISKDYAQAALWIRKAADQNLAVAQNDLASMYVNGAGVPIDRIQAVAWARKAADQGDSHAQ